MNKDTVFPDDLSSEKVDSPGLKSGQFKGFSRSERRVIGGRIKDRAALYTQPGSPNPERGWSLYREAERFCNCGLEWMKFTCEEKCAGECLRFGVPIFCNSRICPDCGKRLYGRIAGELIDFIKPLISQKSKLPRRRNLFMLTLTCDKARFGDSFPDPGAVARFQRETAEFMRLYSGKFQCRFSNGKVLEEQRRIVEIEKTDGSVEKKRREPMIVKGRDGQPREEWRISKGAGWFGVIEIGAENNNLHFHALAFMPWANVRDMRKDWLSITGDSHILKVEYVRGQTYTAKRVAGYVLKYITKPPPARSGGWLAAYIDMLKGVRRLRTGGIFFNRLKFSARERRELCCPYCGNGLVFSSVGYHEQRNPPGQSDCLPLMALLDRVIETGQSLPPPDLVRALTYLRVESERQIDLAWYEAEIAKGKDIFGLTGFDPVAISAA